MPFSLSAAKPRLLIPLIASVQFTYILDFLLLLPLGPDVSTALQFPPAQLAWLTTAYTASSVLAGLFSIRYLDRINRKTGLLICFAALSLFTFLAGMATGLGSLLLARALTGIFGGLSVALAMALVIDATPPERRGAAIGKVMIGISLALIAGVPAALELSRAGGWQLPFYCLGALGVLICLLAAWLLPLEHEVTARQTSTTSLPMLLKQPAVRIACLIQAGNQFSSFLIIPIYSSFFVLNLSYPRAELGMLYLIGGLSALMTMQVLGRLSDYIGPLKTAALATAVVWLGLTPLLDFSLFAPMLAFVLFMSGSAGRNVSVAAACSKIPAPEQRAGFMALLNIVQDLGIVLASLISAAMLSVALEPVSPQAQALPLSGVPALALLALLAACVPLAGLAWLQRHQNQDLNRH
ncbi:MFS transporter [Herbaspirillum lusitanum]|uniref:MFS transporter n=1 Tax=Herbaspirillum lusitanum TaxID=213312 RepID=A0ABW9ADJ4_9BURK